MVKQIANFGFGFFVNYETVFTVFKKPAHLKDSKMYTVYCTGHGLHFDFSID